MTTRRWASASTNERRGVTTVVFPWPWHKRITSRNPWISHAKNGQQKIQFFSIDLVYAKKSEMKPSPFYLEFCILKKSCANYENQTWKKKHVRFGLVKMSMENSFSQAIIFTREKIPGVRFGFNQKKLTESEVGTHDHLLYLSLSCEPQDTWSKTSLSLHL